MITTTCHCLSCIFDCGPIYSRLMRNETMPENTWIKPQYSRAEVNRSGQMLIANSPDFQHYQQALEIVNNWRLAHRFPLNTFQIYLRRQTGRGAVVASRIKRRATIEEKLQFMPNLRIAQMQDIGGCRAIVSSVEQVYSLVDLYKRSKIKHELIKIDDYINAPRTSGYRGVHLIYRYRSIQRPEFNGLKIEIQLRTRMQHAWAAAVETAGRFKEQALKSGMGDSDWLRFFA